MMRATAFVAGLSLVTPAFAAAPVGDEPASTQSTFDAFTVTVSPDLDPTSSGPQYQITVSDADLVLARLSAPYSGSLSKSFVADLNRDGAFEVVVTYTEAETQATVIRVFSWTHELLQPIKLAELDDRQKQGYRGDDEVAVIDGKLVRLFQIYEPRDGGWAVTAAQRKLHYAFDSGRWVAD
jgi:hypothetical protein